MQEQLAQTPDAGQVEHPSNLIDRVTECSLAAVGPELKGPNMNRAYYRVVAIDAAGRIVAVVPVPERAGLEVGGL